MGGNVDVNSTKHKHTAEGVSDLTLPSVAAAVVTLSK